MNNRHNLWYTNHITLTPCGFPLEFQRLRTEHYQDHCLCLPLIAYADLSKLGDVSETVSVSARGVA